MDADESIKTYSREEVRRCLSICLYAVEYYGPTREYAKKMALMIMDGETVLDDSLSVIACLDLALNRDMDLILSFDLENLSQDIVMDYLRMLREELVRH